MSQAFKPSPHYLQHWLQQWLKSPQYQLQLWKRQSSLMSAFCIPPKQLPTMQQIKVKVFCFILFLAQQLRLQELTHQVSCWFMSMTVQQLWQRWTHTFFCCFFFKTIQQFKLPNWLLNIPKHPFTYTKIAVHFVRENGCNTGNSMNTMALLASALLVTLALQD